MSDELAATTPHLSESEALQRLGCCGHVGAKNKRWVGVVVIRQVAETSQSLLTIFQSDRRIGAEKGETGVGGDEFFRSGIPLLQVSTLFCSRFWEISSAFLLSGLIL